MIDEDRRHEIYNIAFQFMIENNISTIPIGVDIICKNLGIELIKLTDIIQDTGLSAADIFSIWGNSDGVLNSFGDICKISYNNTTSPQRQRFTIIEEVSHKLLGHNKNPGFNVFKQNYNAEVYEKYEEEARICAGLILCPPQYFYEYKQIMPRDYFRAAYNVSEPCATVRMQVLWKYESEIKSCELYSRLPKIDLDSQYIRMLFT